MIEWFDDLKVGVRFQTGDVAVSMEDTPRFVSEFDPQPFHLDEEAAKETILGGLAHRDGTERRLHEARHHLAAIWAASAVS